MNEISQFILPVVTGAVGWLGANVKTRRDKKQTDLKIINEAISPLLKSIKDLTDHNHGLTTQLLQEQTKNLALLDEKQALLAERGDLLDQLNKLNKRMAALEKELKKIRSDKSLDAASDPDLKHD